MQTHRRSRRGEHDYAGIVQPEKFPRCQIGARLPVFEIGADAEIGSSHGGPREPRRKLGGRFQGESVIIRAPINDEQGRIESDEQTQIGVVDARRIGGNPHGTGKINRSTGRSWQQPGLTMTGRTIARNGNDPEPVHATYAARRHQLPAIRRPHRSVGKTVSAAGQCGDLINVGLSDK